jgi:hypothetical protein
MKNVFENTVISWSGSDYTIKSNQVLQAIAQIEEIISISDLFDSKPKLAKISMAFGSVLRYAGAKVLDDDVYSALVRSNDETVTAVTAINALLTLMLPADMIPEDDHQDVEPKKKTKK